jgi:hypothetical protein
MTLPELMDALAARDIDLSLRLVIDASYGVMTDELRRELDARKPALISKLAESVQEPVHEPAEPGPDLSTVTQGVEPVPLDVPMTRSWHRSIVWWPATRRKWWTDRAKTLQAEGLPRDQAEWAAFLEAVAEINQAEAAGERIDFQVPADHPGTSPPSF